MLVSLKHQPIANIYSRRLTGEFEKTSLYNWSLLKPEYTDKLSVRLNHGTLYSSFTLSAVLSLSKIGSFYDV